ERSAPISRNRSTPTPCTARMRRKPRKSRLRISSRPSISIAAEQTTNPARTRASRQLGTRAPSAAPSGARNMTNLLDLTHDDLAAFFAARGEKPFRARQVSRWIHQRFVAEVAAMTDLARPLRERLAAEAE